jgi:hypothetical protein
VILSPYYMVREFRASFQPGVAPVSLVAYWPRIAVFLRDRPNGPVRVSGIFTKTGRLTWLTIMDCELSHHADLLVLCSRGGDLRTNPGS